MNTTGWLVLMTVLGVSVVAACLSFYRLRDELRLSADERGESE